MSSTTQKLSGNLSSPLAGSSADRASRYSVDRSRRAASVPSAFEPVHRPEPQNPLCSSPTRATIGQAPVPQLTIPGSIGFGSQPSQASAAPSAGVGLAGGSSSGGRFDRGQAAFPQGIPATGFQALSRGTQAGVGAGSGGGGGIAQQPLVVPMPIPVYAAPPPPQPVAGQLPQPLQSVFPPEERMVGPGYAVPGQAGPGYSGPQVAFDPIATQYSYSDGGAGAGATVPGAGYSYPAQTAPPPPGVYNYGSQAYVPVGPAQQLAYQPSRAFVPASSDGGRNARIYYPAGAPIPMPAPGAPPPPPPQPVSMMNAASPGHYPASMPMTPIATGTPVRAGHAVPVNFDGSFAALPPSPIRE